MNTQRVSYDFDREDEDQYEYYDTGNSQPNLASQRPAQAYNQLSAYPTSAMQTYPPYGYSHSQSAVNAPYPQVYNAHPAYASTGYPSYDFGNNLAAPSHDTYPNTFDVPDEDVRRACDFPDECPRVSLNTLDELQFRPRGRVQHSHSTLIRHAILGSVDKKMTLGEITDAIEARFPYFKTQEKWKGSIRHHLSLSKHFVRVARPAHERGRGAYWTVDLNALADNKQEQTPPPRGPAHRPTLEGSYADLQGHAPDQNWGQRSLSAGYGASASRSSGFDASSSTSAALRSSTAPAYPMGSSTGTGGAGYYDSSYTYY